MSNQTNQSNGQENGNDLLQNFKNAAKSAKGDKVPYILDEVLTIMAMFEEKLKPAQVSDLTGRTVHTLRYKFLEGEIELKNKKTGEVKTVIRSIKRFNSTAEIYTHFGVTVPDDIASDVRSRIESYKAVLASRLPSSEEVA